MLPRLVVAAPVVAALVLTTAVACPADDPVGTPGTVVSTRVETVGDGEGVRVVATLEDAAGNRWDVRLPATTACVVGAAYPACAER